MTPRTRSATARRGLRRPALALLVAGAFGAAESRGQEAEPETGEDRDAAIAEARRLDAVVVTGTRIRRIEVEGPLPVSVVEREDLLRGAAPSLSDAIRDLPWNSAGSLGDIPNSDTPNLSLPDLRGLGAKYTLTLVDGQRLPGFAAFQGGAAASVTGIPLAAIDRVEVLRDGASAIYGSDAIGGVINLITRREDTPPQFELQWEQPAQDGGGAWRAGFATAHAGPRGHLLVALEALDREPLLGSQRDYFLANAAVSFSGNPGSFRRINPATGDFVGFFEPDPRCPAGFDTDPVFPSSRVEPRGLNRLCFFRFRDENMERAAYAARSAFASGRFEVGDRLSGFARLLGIDGEGRTQLAPTPAGGLQLAPDNPSNPTLGERGPGLGWPLVINYRLSALGPRVTEVDERTWHALAGIEGGLDWSDGGDWKVSLFHNRYDSRAEGVSGFALRTGLIDAVASGAFNPFTAEPGDPTGLEQAQVRPWSEGRTRANGAELAFTLDTPFWFGLSASHAFGLDLRRDQYGLAYDPRSRAGEVLGQGAAAPPEIARRDYAGVYGELFLPLAERWELSLAARYDHYQDAGGRFSPKLALAFRPGERWLLRGSLGRGFQAPDLASAYGSGVRTSGIEVDPTECALDPADPIACEPRFFEVDIVPNAALGPERARQASLGVVWQPASGFHLALDYFRTRIVGRISTLEPADALANEFNCARDGRQCDPVRDGRVLRDAFGNVERVVLPYINLAGVRTESLDLESHLRFSPALGELAFSLRASRVLALERQLSPGAEVEALVGTLGRPHWRGDLGLDWQRGTHGASIGIEYLDGYAACLRLPRGDEAPNPLCAGRVSSHTEIDAQWRWRAPWGGEFALGARNLRDRPPSFAPDGNYAYGLYDPNGRVGYLRYRQSF